MKIGRKKTNNVFRTHFSNTFAEKNYFVYHLAKTCLLLQKHEQINLSTLIQREIEKIKYIPYYSLVSQEIYLLYYDFVLNL